MTQNQNRDDDLIILILDHVKKQGDVEINALCETCFEGYDPFQVDSHVRLCMSENLLFKHSLDSSLEPVLVCLTEEGHRMLMARHD